MTDTRTNAKAAKLRYFSDTKPGISRQPNRKKGFSYALPDGTPIEDEDVLARIAALGIPPAWTEVWISPHANGHIQATGRDAKGRKQYRYHPNWSSHRSETKYTRMAQFGHMLPTLRERVDADLRAVRGMTRERVLALVVRLLEITLIRIGNAEYRRHNEHYGLTTLQDDHVAVNGSRVAFEFVGKSGKTHTVELQDRRLARLVKACQELEGYDLFQYRDGDGTSRPVGSADVNAYLRERTGEDYTAKDFRTWGGSVLAVEALCDLPECTSEMSDAETKRNIAAAVKQVAAGLGNTATISRKYYIHPAIIEAYSDGMLHDLLAAQNDDESPHGLSRYEKTLMALLGNLA